MEALLSALIGVLTAGGVYLMLRGRSFPVVLGLTLLSYAVNLFLFAMGRLAIGQPPVIGPEGTRRARRRSRRRGAQAMSAGTGKRDAR